MPKSLQEMHGRAIQLPSSRNARPAKDKLAERYELFATR